MNSGSRSGNLVQPVDAGQYEMLDVVGRGVYGFVTRGKKKDTQEIVAIKVSGGFSHIAHNEARVLKRLNELNPDKNNFVKFYGSFEYHDSYCVVLEMLDKTLWHFCRGKPLEVIDIRFVTEQLLVAVKALSSLGLVHADIKPDNIMLVNQKRHPYRIKLIDFGVTSGRFEQGKKVQAVGYRAPEVILGLSFGNPIDMWSLGCVMAFLYLGKDLYGTTCEYEVIRVITQMRGPPDYRMLSNGRYSREYFNKIGDSMNPVWTLKTHLEFVTQRGRTSQLFSRSIANNYTCLEDMKKAGKKSKNTQDGGETDRFFSLLKKMLSVNPDQRITACQALEHAFIQGEKTEEQPENNGAVSGTARPSAGAIVNPGTAADDAWVEANTSTTTTALRVTKTKRDKKTPPRSVSASSHVKNPTSEVLRSKISSHRRSPGPDVAGPPQNAPAQPPDPDVISTAEDSRPRVATTPPQTPTRTRRRGFFSRLAAAFTCCFKAKPSRPKTGCVQTRDQGLGCFQETDQDGDTSILLESNARRGSPDHAHTSMPQGK